MQNLFFLFSLILVANQLKSAQKYTFPNEYLCEQKYIYQCVVGHNDCNLFKTATEIFIIKNQ